MTQGHVHPPGYRNGRLYFHGDRSHVLETDFDVEAYTNGARGRIAVAVDEVQLSADVRADLDFLWRQESGALGDMRAMLASWTSKEARITAFLATWAYERYWNARALRDLLAADGGSRPERRTPLGVAGRVRHLYAEYVLPCVAPVAGIVVGEPITAGHMSRMAVHEAALQVAYRGVLDRVGQSTRETLREIMSRRTTFISFFRQEALARIQRSRVEAVSARIHLAWPWSPLRPDAVPEPDERERVISLFRNRATRRALAEEDAVIGGLLPGRVQPAVDAINRCVRRPLPRTLRRSSRGL